MLNLVLHFLHGSAYWGVLLGKNSDGNDVSGNTAGSAEVGLLSDVDVWHVLVFAEEGQMKDDLKWLGVASEHDQVSASSVQSLGSLIRSLLQQLEVLCLIQEIQDLLLHVVVSLWPSSRLFDGFLYRQYYNQYLIILQYLLEEIHSTRTLDACQEKG